MFKKASILLQSLMLILMMSTATLFVACGDDEDEVVAGDKTQLNALIADLETIANSATTADYPQAAIDEFKAAIQTAKTAAQGTLTQEQINNLITQLNEAKASFESKAYGYIDESLYLIMGWHFDEGDGTTTTDYSSNHYVGTFKRGSVDVLGEDALMPSWTNNGLKGKAIYYNKGAHLEVPYASAFLPSNLTISVWIKPDELYEHNYIISQNYWNGYKLQTQGAGKPFFTYKKADGNIIDADNETDNSVKAGQWNHIVITLDGTAKLLKFYVNGTLTKTWDEATKGIGPLTQTLTNPDPQPFIIGGVATDAELLANFMEWTTAENLGYFKGIIDELMLYNIALTEGQVTKLYNSDKP